MAVDRLPPTVTTQNDGFLLVGASTVHEAVDDDPGPPSQPDELATNANAKSTNQFDFYCLSKPLRPASAFASVKIIGRARNETAPGGGNGWQVIAKRLDSTVLTSSLQAGTSFTEVTLTVTAPGGGWTNEEVDGLQFGIRATGQDPTVQKTATMVFKEVDFTLAPQSVEQHRHVGSQVLLSRLNQLHAPMGLPLPFLDVDLMEPFAVSSRTFPSEDGKGRGSKRWQRLLLTAMRADADPMSNSVIFQGFKMPRVNYWDVGQSLISVDRAGLAPGVARLNTGGTRIFTRASRAYGLDPSGTMYAEFPADTEAIVKDGMLLERASTTRIWNSVFVNGFTNWTKINDGTGGVAITLDTAKFLFEKTATITTQQSVKVVNGAATNGALQQQTNFTYPEGSKLTVSMIHQDEATGSQLTMRIKNVTTGNWLQSNGTWAAGEANAFAPGNTLVHKRSFGTFTMENIGGGAADSQLLVKIQFNGASKTGWIFHVQIEDAPGSSPIVSAAADETRAIAKLALSNNFGSRVFNMQHGYVALEVVPGFSDADITTVRMAFSIKIDANNNVVVGYAPGIGWFNLVTQGGTQKNAIKGTLAVRGTPAQIVARWTSSEGQLGLAANTSSIFVNGVKGTDIVHVKPSMPETIDAWFGSLEGTSDSLDGLLRNVRIGSDVPTDIEVQRMF